MSNGMSIPADQFPAQLATESGIFQLGSRSQGAKNAVSCRGQQIALPKGGFDRVYILAAATEDTTGEFAVGASKTLLAVPSWTGFIGQFDNRIWANPFPQIDYKGANTLVGLNAGYIKRTPVAWFCTHRHSAKGNEAYHFSYLFNLSLPVSPGVETLVLPVNEKIKVFAVNVARSPAEAAVPAQPLYDDFSNRGPIELRKMDRALTYGMEPVGKVISDKKNDFQSLCIGAPSANDYADAHSGNGVTFQYAGIPPHPRSGANGLLLARLNDGEWAHNDDDTSRSVWWDTDGRFYADLKKNIRIEKINTYSLHRSSRAQQLFYLWGSNAEQMPGTSFETGMGSGWTLIARVDTTSLGDGGVHGSSVTGAKDAPLGPFRWLLWTTDDQGTFFSEIDIHEAK